MTVKYRHTRGIIQDNALTALLTDPLFRQRRENNKKGKGSYSRKHKQGKATYGEASGKNGSTVFTTGLLLSASDSSIFTAWG